MEAEPHEQVLAAETTQIGLGGNRTPGGSHGNYGQKRSWVLGMELGSGRDPEAPSLSACSACSIPGTPKSQVPVQENSYLVSWEVVPRVPWPSLGLPVVRGGLYSGSKVLPCRQFKSALIPDKVRIFN